MRYLSEIVIVRIVCVFVLLALGVGWGAIFGFWNGVIFSVCGVITFVMIQIYEWRRNR